MATFLASSAPDILTEPTTKQKNRVSIMPNEAAEDSQSTEFILTETKRLVRLGLYKKALNLVETFRTELANISTINHIKLCRRMVFCLTKICERFLSKNELHKPERFKLLMNKSFDYLQTWSELLSKYVCQRDPKYRYLHRVLEEATNVRNKLVLINTARETDTKATEQQETGPNTTREGNITQDNNSTRDTTKTNTSRQRPSILKVIEKSSLQPRPSFEAKQKVSSEILEGPEINTSYHLDEFVKYYLTILLNWANFYKRTNKKYDAYARILKLAVRLANIFDSCLHPDILHVVAKIRIAQGCLYTEFERYEEAMQLFEPTINILQTEISLRMERRNEVKDGINFMYKFRTTIRLLLALLLNMVVVYEVSESYENILETLKLAKWFAVKFLNPEDDVYQMVAQRFSSAQIRYDAYLRELGEVERMIGIRHDRMVDDEQEVNQANHVFKINYYMYNRFNYDKLNASQFIVLNSPNNASQTYTPRENRSDAHMDKKHSILDHRSSLHNRFKEIQTDSSIGRTMDTQECDSPRSNVSWKRPSMFMRSNTKRNSTKIKKSARLSETQTQTTPRLTSDYYRKEVDIEKEREEFEITSDEENEYIEKLNRNIKGFSRRKGRKVTRKQKDPVEDLDNYFAKIVDNKIKSKEEKSNIKPLEFRNVVKNYGFFMRKEAFDHREFEFAKTSLSARNREYLGDTAKDMSYKLPDNSVAQSSRVKVEAQQLEAKFEAQNRVNIRNLKQRAREPEKPVTKNVRFIYKSEEPNKENKSLEPIEESNPSQTKKLNLVNILLRHKNQFGLDQFDENLKRKEKMEAKRKEYSTRKNELNDFGFKTVRSSPTKTRASNDNAYNINQSASHRHYDSEKSKEYSILAKTMIHHLMESVEKSMEEDQDIKSHLELNKPLVPTQKKIDKFLKVPDDLAKSTLHLSDSVDGNRKMWNFSQVVKSAQAVFKKSALSKTPKHG